MPRLRALDVLRGLADPVAKTGSGTRSRPVRMLLALALLLLGLVALLGGHEKSIQLLRPLAGILLLIAGIAIALGPWWLRIARDLSPSARLGSGPRNGPRWPRECTTRCCRRWP